MGSKVGVSVLFTDLVGSTALAAELGPERAERLRVEHFGLLRKAVNQHDGTVVKNLGDGIMAVFSGASAALDAAVAMQRSIHRHNASDQAVMAIRVGVATGDCTTEDGDYFGEPVVQAARLCARAAGGEILAHAVLRMLVPRDSHDLVTIGDLELKGLPEPVPAIRVDWTPDEGTTSFPLQSRLTVEHLAPHVGRTHELAVLHDGLKRASQGQRTVVLITGEAGLGKTRLACTFATQAAQTGAAVLYGRCDEELAVPYLPWIESLDHYVEHADDEAVAALDEATIGQLSRMLPALERRVPRGAAVAGARGDQYALVASVSRLLSAMASNQTAVLILDDLHWADAGSLLVLRQIASSLVGVRLLIVGTYRETDLGPDDALSEATARLHREEGVHRLALGGLSDIEVVELVEAVAGHELDEDGIGLAHSMRADAAGNPFFLVELLRHLAEAGQLVRGKDGRWTIAPGLPGLTLPQSVRDVVGQRVRRLGAESHAILTAAAVAGREFDAEVVARASDVDEDDVLDRLEDAMAAGLIAEVAEVPGRFTFAHALVQHTLYEELSASRRSRMHRRVAEAIEGIVGDEPGTRVGELAKHWFAAVRPAELEKAITYAVKAGERALDTAAPEEAVRWFAQALDAAGEGDPHLRCELLARLGDAERRAGHETYRRRLLDAAALAERVGRHEVLVEAAISNYRGIYSSVGQIDAERVAVLEAALGRIGDSDPAAQARVLATLAGELTYEDDPRRVDFARRAIALARSSGDDLAVVDVLERIGSALGTPMLLLEERDQQSREAMEVTSAGSDPVRRFFALDRRTPVLVELGDMEGARACSSERRAIADRMREPTLMWIATYGEAALDLWEGDLEAAIAGNEAALAIGMETGQPDALLWFAAHVIQSNWHRGQYEETLDLIAQAIERAPSVCVLPSVQAVFQFRAGRTDDARRAVAELADAGWRITQDVLWLTTTAVSAEAAHLVGDRASAEELRDRLLPFAGHVVAARGTCQGAVSFHLGLLAITLGLRDEAERWLLDAVDRNGRLRTPFFRARALLALAELRRETNPSSVATLVAEASQAVERYDIGALRSQVRTLGG